MSARHPRILRGLVVAGLLVALLALTGCGAFDKDKNKTFTLSDPEGLFHVRVPGTWEARVEPGLMGLYASKKMPTSDELETLSVVVFNGKPKETKTPVDKRLLDIVKQRGTDRKWTDAKIGKPEKTKIGKRDAYKVFASGKDAKGRLFASDYYLVRTSGKEVFIVCVAPEAKWKESEPSVKTLTENWFWHYPEELLEEAVPASSTPAGQQKKK